MSIPVRRAEVEKKHFLVIWPTIRKDWVSAFLELADEFRFTFIPATFPEEPNYAAQFDCRYWSEFDSAQQTLDEIRPDALIFMSIESGLSMSINRLAKKRGIKTIILQHGIFTNYRDYRVREKLWRKGARARKTRETQSSKGFSSLRFVSKSLTGLGKLWLPPLALYIRLQQRIGPYWTARHFPLPIKWADLYLCYSPFNATIHKETDRIGNHRIKYIGSHELIKYLQEVPDKVDERFYLHLDQALAENSFGEETLGPDQMITFYEKLNSYCLKEGAKLYIKLHPESYHSTWLPQHENIVYLRHTEDLNRLIQSALGCFGFYSTMIIPAIYWKPTVLFHIAYSGLQEAIKPLNITSIFDFYSFQPDDIIFPETNVESRELIQQKFILPTGVNETALFEILNAN